jgi:hypothetical protein
MSTARILEVFNQAGGGKVKASTVRLRYVHTAGPNMQVLEIDGTAHGRHFAIASDPFDPSINPQIKATELASKLAAEAPADPPVNP